MADVRSPGWRKCPDHAGGCTCPGLTYFRDCQRQERDVEEPFHNPATCNCEHVKQVHNMATHVLVTANADGDEADDAERMLSGPHLATKRAHSASLGAMNDPAAPTTDDEAAVLKYARRALGKSKGGDNEAAARAHTKCADAHEAISTSAKMEGDWMAAKDHTAAEMKHRSAAQEQYDALNDDEEPDNEPDEDDMTKRLTANDMRALLAYLEQRDAEADLTANMVESGGGLAIPTMNYGAEQPAGTSQPTRNQLYGSAAGEGLPCPQTMAAIIAMNRADARRKGQQGQARPGQRQL